MFVSERHTLVNKISGTRYSCLLVVRPFGPRFKVIAASASMYMQRSHAEPAGKTSHTCDLLGAVLLVDCRVAAYRYAAKVGPLELEVLKPVRIPTCSVGHLAPKSLVIFSHVDPKSSRRHHGHTCFSFWSNQGKSCDSLSKLTGCEVSSKSLMHQYPGTKSHLND